MKIEGVKDLEFQAAVEAAHAEGLAKALELNCAMARNGELGPRLERLIVEFSGRLATRAGQAELNRTTGHMKIKLNYRLLKANPDQIRSTYLHELAHIVANLTWNDNCGHDQRWKRVAKALGDDAGRRHDMDVSALKPKRKPLVRYAWSCGCRQWMLTRRKHDAGIDYQARNGRSRYSCPSCKGKVLPPDNMTVSLLKIVVDQSGQV